MTVDRYAFGSMLFTMTYHFARLERAFCKSAGLYQGQPRILTILKENEGVTLSELSSLCSIGLPSLSVTLKNLQKSEMIRKEGSGKHQTLFLTEKGREHAMAFHREIDRFYSEYLSGFKPDQVQEFYRYIAGFDRFVQEYCESIKES